MRTPAFVNRSRWVARCPTPGCPSAQRLAPHQPTIYCPRCERAAVVEWPPALDLTEATRVLTRRPDPRTRNWHPTMEAAAYAGADTVETVDDLREENEAHGVDRT